MYTNFFEGLRDLGFAEGRNIAVQSHFADNNMQRLPELAVLLVKQNVDLIITHGTPAVRAVQQATATIPIVALVFADPVSSGFAASLARPGGNITGMSNLSEEIAAKRLEILAEIVPHVTRIARFVNPDNPVNMRGRSTSDAVARKIGKEFIYVEVRAADQLSAAFDQIVRDRAGALQVSDDSVLNALRPRIAELAMNHNLPSMFASLGAAGEGLVSYGPNSAQLGRRAATLAAKILKGEKPANLPIEQPTEFVLTVNLKTAKALGITIPQSVMVRATRVIE